MEQMITTTHSDTEHKKDTERYPLVVITRTFHAPVERVFHAWSDAELIEEWYGPEGFTSPQAKTDFRVGGKYLFAMESPDGKVSWATGVYTEIILNEKIVCTNQASDKNGNTLNPADAGMPSDLPENLYITVEFDKFNNDQTMMTLSHEGFPKEMFDECVAGWNSTLNKLQKLVEQHQIQ